MKMAASALEEKINKIRQQNEEIKRRHEEVEADKKKAAKLNALVQMVPSTDWPDRKEPPEFSNPPRVNNKPKPAKEHHDHPPQQYHSVSGEGRKVHPFAQGQGPPPDPKYNFLADSEREGGNVDNTKDNSSSRGQKHSRGTFRKKSAGKDGMQRDYRVNRGGGSHRDEHQPEYEAWRAERNRIDEDRISRQRTAEGNWRREWDNDKAHIMNEVTRSECKLGDYVKKDHKDFDRRYHANGNDYAHHNRGGGNHRSYRGNSRHFHNNYENRSNNAYYQDGHAKNTLSPGSDERTVVATDRGIKVTLNQGNMSKALVTSVKVNSPSIAGTGRVGPRQRSRVTYSSHSDVEMTSFETESFSRPKSFEDKTKGIHHDNPQRSPNARKTQQPLRRKELGNKSPYMRKKEIRRTEECKDSPKAQSEPQKLVEDNCNQRSGDEAVEVERETVCDAFALDKAEAKDVVVKVNDEQPVDSITAVEEIHDAKMESEIPADEVHAKMDNEISVDEVHAEMENEISVDEVHAKLENETPVDIEMEVEASVVAKDESIQPQIIEEAVLSEREATQTDLTIQDTNDKSKNEIDSAANASCDVKDDTEETTKENEKQSQLAEQSEEIPNDNCNKQNENVSQQENSIKHDTKDSLEENEAANVVSSSVDTSPVMEEKPANNEMSEEKETCIAENEKVITDVKNVAIDEVESTKEDSRAEEEKATPGEMSEKL